MSACPVLYPENPPLDCIRELVRILRAGSIYQERANFAAHAWNVQGYLQRMLVGNPRPLIAEVSLSTDDAIRALEKIALVGSELHSAAGGNTPSSVISSTPACGQLAEGRQATSGGISGHSAAGGSLACGAVSGLKSGWPVSLTALLRYLVSRLIDALLEEGR